MARAILRKLDYVILATVCHLDISVLYFVRILTVAIL